MTKRYRVRIWTLGAGAGLAGLLLGGCASVTGNNASLATTSSAKPSEASANAPAFSQFSDLPVPPNAQMDLDRTLILGGQDTWIGRLVMSCSNAASEMYDFYKQEMPRFGWNEVTSVRSASSIITYTRGPRVATLTIAGGKFGATIVEVTVSPHQAGGPGGSGGRAPSPAPLGPPAR